MARKQSLFRIFIVFGIIFFLMYTAIIISDALTERRNTGEELVAPVGVDFAMFYSVGEMAASGNAADIYDLEKQQAMTADYLQIETVNHDLQWFYPPTILLMLMAALSRLPFLTAGIIWMAATLALAVFGVSKLLPGHKALALLTLGYSAVPLGLAWGQNCFLSVALISLGIAYAKKRPVLAGLMFGLLTYKPQLAVFPFLILLFAGEWKVLKWSVLFSLLWIGLSVLVFTTEVWVVYLNNIFYSENPLQEAIWRRTASLQPTLHTTLRLLGLRGIWLQILQYAIWVASIFVVSRIWRREGNVVISGSAMIFGLLLATPYYIQYDLMLLCIPFVLLIYDAIENGWKPAAILIIPGLFLVPLVNRVIMVMYDIQITPLVLAAALLWVWRQEKPEKRNMRLNKTGK